MQQAQQSSAASQHFPVPKYAFPLGAVSQMMLLFSTKCPAAWCSFLIVLTLHDCMRAMR